MNSASRPGHFDPGVEEEHADQSGVGQNVGLLEQRAGHQDVVALRQAGDEIGRRAVRRRKTAAQFGERSRVDLLREALHHRVEES